MPLRTLRHRIVVLPQDTAMFSGTLRENLDPLGVHTDEEIWDCLRAVQLLDFVTAQPAGLGVNIPQHNYRFNIKSRNVQFVRNPEVRAGGCAELTLRTKWRNGTGQGYFRCIVRQRLGVCHIRQTQSFKNPFLFFKYSLARLGFERTSFGSKVEVPHSANTSFLDRNNR